MEMELVQNSNWILTKRRIVDKVCLMFGMLADEYDLFLTKKINQSDSLPSEVLVIPPKISKGENYQGLPYVVLDYPRYFDKKNIFAVRTFFWWGNFFSSTLQLKGKYKNQTMPIIASNYSLFKKNNYYISTGSDEWDFRFNKKNLTPLGGLNMHKWMETITEKEFIKLSSKIPLVQWNQADKFLLNYFKINMLGVLANFPNDEINL